MHDSQLWATQPKGMYHLAASGHIRKQALNTALEKKLLSCINKLFELKAYYFDIWQMLNSADTLFGL